MIRKIMVPVDGSEHAGAAIDWASDLAIKYQAPLLLLHVITERATGAIPEELRAFAEIEHVGVTDWDIIEAVARRILDDADRRARSRGAKNIETALAGGNPAAEILERAKRFKPDLIVMGRRGLGPLSSLFLGSVSSKVLNLADCACLTVK